MNEFFQRHKIKMVSPAKLLQLSQGRAQRHFDLSQGRPGDSLPTQDDRALLSVSAPQGFVIRESLYSPLP
jgi:hypothetical protein